MTSNILIDFFGYRYDGSIPSFVGASPKLVLHRPTMRLIDRASLSELFSDAGYTPAPQEIGSSPVWLLDNTGIGETQDVVPPSTPPTVATEGTPGTFDEDTPYNLTTLRSLGALGNTSEWVNGGWVSLGDGSEAYWDGTDWQFGRASGTPPAVIQIAVVGGGTDRIDFTVTNGPQVGAGTVTITGISVASDPIDNPPVVNLADGDTDDDIAAKISAALDGLQNAGDTITCSSFVTNNAVELHNDSFGQNFDANPTVVVA